MMSRKDKKVSTTLNYIEKFLILASAIIGCTSIFGFGLLLNIPKAIASSAIELKICAITTGIKTYMSTIKKNEKKRGKKKHVK